MAALRTFPIGCHVLMYGVVSLLWACGDNEIGTADFEMYDSAGVLLSENSFVSAPLATWALSDRPLLTLGRLEGGGPDEFFRISQALSLKDGRIAVANSGTGEIRIFDRLGRHQITMGRRGEGPGEFGLIGWMAELPGDSLLAIDPLNARALVFGLDGTLVRSWFTPRAAGASTLQVVGRLNDGSLVFQGRGLGRQRAAYEWTTLLYMLTPEGELRALGEYLDRRLGGNGLPLGFGGKAFFAARGTTIWYGQSDRYALRQIDVDGRVGRIVRVNSPSLVVSEGDINRAETAVRESLERQNANPTVMHRVMATEFAENHPTFNAFVVDELGFLWTRRGVESDHEERTSTWDVLDREGRLLGTIAMPAGLEVSQIGSDFVLGVHQDSVGVERVLLYELKRDPS